MFFAMFDVPIWIGAVNVKVLGTLQAISTVSALLTAPSRSAKVELQSSVVVVACASPAGWRAAAPAASESMTRNADRCLRSFIGLSPMADQAAECEERPSRQESRRSVPSQWIRVTRN